MIEKTTMNAYRDKDSVHHLLGPKSGRRRFTMCLRDTKDMVATQLSFDDGLYLCAECWHVMDTGAAV